MSSRVEFVPSATKDFSQLEGSFKPRIIKAFDAISLDPALGKPLQGPYHGLRSCRVGEYRIVYKMDAKQRTVLIYRIGHRRDIYRA
ncbi:MAG: hypothetical protein A3J74_10355 [Elusimicrobia bacterium RIFCSPHIGHO2_02_FULL_57_9]|nr:MAG: hypothetical protein A3J74_10355 [Elusimicrobia bacterium RIFCSPHIGHO2_02_FULL_57_9]